MLVNFCPLCSAWFILGPLKRILLFWEQLQVGQVWEHFCHCGCSDAIHCCGALQH